jgi:thymidylate kinase
MTRGCLFVLEGLDRCGKSTQAALLSQRPNTDSIRFPDRTSPTGQLINAYLASAAELDDRAVLLLFSANRWEKRAKITEAMLAGRSVVADRSVPLSFFIRNYLVLYHLSSSGSINTPMCILRTWVFIRWRRGLLGAWL